jgi:hypothetical protein
MALSHTHLFTLNPKLLLALVGTVILVSELLAIHGKALHSDNFGAFRFPVHESLSHVLL